MELRDTSDAIGFVFAICCPLNFPPHSHHHEALLGLSQSVARRSPAIPWALSSGLSHPSHRPVVYPNFQPLAPLLPRMAAPSLPFATHPTLPRALGDGCRVGGMRACRVGMNLGCVEFEWAACNVCEFSSRPHICASSHSAWEFFFCTLEGRCSLKDRRPTHPPRRSAEAPQHMLIPPCPRSFDPDYTRLFGFQIVRAVMCGGDIRSFALCCRQRACASDVVLH